MIEKIHKGSDRLPVMAGREGGGGSLYKPLVMSSVSCAMQGILIIESGMYKFEPNLHGVS